MFSKVTLLKFEVTNGMCAPLKSVCVNFCDTPSTLTRMSLIFYKNFNRNVDLINRFSFPMKLFLSQQQLRIFFDPEIFWNIEQTSTWFWLLRKVFASCSFMKKFPPSVSQWNVEARRNFIKKFMNVSRIFTLSRCLWISHCSKKEKKNFYDNFFSSFTDLGQLQILILTCSLKA